MNGHLTICTLEPQGYHGLQVSLDDFHSLGIASPPLCSVTVLRETALQFICSVPSLPHVHSHDNNNNNSERRARAYNHAEFSGSFAATSPLFQVHLPIAQQ
jgi:hypothetical protein